MASTYYAPKLPLEVNDQADFYYIKDALQNVKQKLRMIILTNPGEKIMDPAFGVGIKKYIFEPELGMVHVTKQGTVTKISLDNFKYSLSSEIIKQVNTYSPEIIIKNVDISAAEQVLNVVINYSYKGFIIDNLTLSINS